MCYFLLKVVEKAVSTLHLLNCLFHKVIGGVSSVKIAVWGIRTLVNISLHFRHTLLIMIDSLQSAMSCIMPSDACQVWFPKWMKQHYLGTIEFWLWGRQSINITLSQLNDSWFVYFFVLKVQIIIINTKQKMIP